MRIAFLSQYVDEVLPPDQSSIGIFTYEVARKLAVNDEVTVLARYARGQPARTLIDGVVLERLLCTPQRAWGYASRAWRHLFPRARPLQTQSCYALDYILHAIWRLRRLNPDVIHVQNLPLHLPMIRRALPQTAIVLHMHCDWLAQLDHGAMQRAVACADIVIGCSQHVVDTAQARHGESGARFAVLPNGVATDATPADDSSRDAQRVVFVGRLSPEKGIHTLLDAWLRVLDRHPHARLEIIGPAAETPREFLADLSDDPKVRDLSRFYPGGAASAGAYHRALRAMIPDAAAHTITFAGQLPHVMAQQRIATAALLVNPSLSESFGMSLIEALNAGTPIIATRVGGMPEIAAAVGAAGTLVRMEDSHELADEISRILANPAAAAAAARDARQLIVARYDWGRIAELARGLYAEALASRKARAANRAASGAKSAYAKAKAVADPHRV